MNKVENMIVRGINGTINFHINKIVIERKGVISFLSQGLKGDKTIYLSDISAIQFKNAGIFTNGIFNFLFMVELKIKVEFLMLHKMKIQ